jgi:hypothetical protein
MTMEIAASTIRPRMVAAVVVPYVEARFVDLL